MLLWLWMLLIAYSLADADGLATEYSSGSQRVPLVELYTSEGCSSCPPADRWLSKLQTDPDLWNKITPIAFHVDYWDYIGWTDAFAQSAFGDRQRRYADEGASRFVYTPGMFRGGSEWNGWRFGRSASGDNDEVGTLNLTVKNSVVAARFETLEKRYVELTLHVAVLGMGIETRVKAGENKGKTLHHDFVALDLVSVPLDTTGNGHEAITELPNMDAYPEQRAIVAWVSAKGDQMPIQSVGGLLR
ncbi:MAG: DUF1223 domain-containing protein [Woeseiaceae bacterium]